eukprot:PhM_4_TR3279/c0_g1_i1/m.106549
MPKEYIGHTAGKRRTAPYSRDDNRGLKRVASIAKDSVLFLADGVRTWWSQSAKASDGAPLHGSSNLLAPVAPAAPSPRLTPAPFTFGATTPDVPVPSPRRSLPSPRPGAMVVPPLNLTPVQKPVAPNTSQQSTAASQSVTYNFYYQNPAHVGVAQQPQMVAVSSVYGDIPMISTPGRGSARGALQSRTPRGTWRRPMLEYSATKRAREDSAEGGATPRPQTRNASKPNSSLVDTPRDFALGESPMPKVGPRKITLVDPPTKTAAPPATLASTPTTIDKSGRPSITTTPSTDFNDSGFSFGASTPATDKKDDKPASSGFSFG